MNENTAIDPESEQNSLLFTTVQDEYRVLKQEQRSRIGFRDNLLYMTLGVVGGLSAYALSAPNHHHALLLLPWACFILGWTYLMNDRKISDIGRYIRGELSEEIGKIVGVPKETLFRWEYAHRREEEGRFRRKLFQLVVDLTAFCLSSAVGLLTFLRLVANPSTTALILVWAGWILTLILAAWIWTYADFSQ